jgi:hypothetical protein
MSYRTLELQEIYKHCRNRVYCLVRQAKREFMAKFLIPTLPAKILWKHLDSLGVRDKDDAPLNFCPNTLNSYFALSNVPGQTVHPSLNEESGGFSPSTGFAFSNVTPQEVFDAIFKIKTNSVGLDEIPLRFLKLFINSTLNHLTYIFNAA